MSDRIYKRICKAMGSAKAKHIATAMALFSIPFLTGCGSNQTSTPPPGAVPNPIGVMPPGVAACVPITSQIPFTAVNIPYDGTYRINVQLGQAVVGGAVGMGGPYQAQNPFNGSSVSMSITPAQAMAPQTPYPAYPGYQGYQGYQSYPGYTGLAYGSSDLHIQGPVNISGFVQLGASDINAILTYVQSGMIQIPGVAIPPVAPVTPTPGYPIMPILPPTPAALPNPQSICVSAIRIAALDVQLDTTRMYNGDVYLYFNHSQHGYILAF